MVDEMQLRIAGLIAPSGRHGWRVRVEGDKARRISIPCGPDDPDFWTIYHAARRGVKLQPTERPQDTALPQSVAWLSYRYEDHMTRMVAADRLAEGTRKQRTAFLVRLRTEYGHKHMAMPASAVVELRDTMSATPGAADNMVKAIRALYAWAIERGHVTDNPAKGIGRINRGTGAVPWSIDDLKSFRQRHPKGTMAHLALTLFMFTACRIGDAYRLGRDHEIRRGGITYLDWQPAKKGSARVVVPILPPLATAIAAQKIIGSTYLLNGWGRPFASSAAFGNWFRDRVHEAGLVGRSPHGIRKAAGELLALEGATQYHIMAVHGHTQAKTSEGYTSGVNRQRLAEEAMRMLRGLEW